MHIQYSFYIFKSMQNIQLDCILTVHIKPIRHCINLHTKVAYMQNAYLALLTATREHIVRRDRHSYKHMSEFYNGSFYES